MVTKYCNLLYSCSMKRRIITYGRYFGEFMKGTQDRLPAKFVKHIRDGLYELRTEYNGNIYRVFSFLMKER